MNLFVFGRVKDTFAASDLQIDSRGRYEKKLNRHSVGKMGGLRLRKYRLSQKKPTII